MAEQPAFPLRKVLGAATGFLGAVVLFGLIPFDPADEMPALAAIPRPLPALRGLEAPPEPGERRIFVVGASLTAGYPYQPEPVASYAALIEAGLRAVHPEMRIHVRPAAKPALDSPRLAAIVASVLEARPALVCVALGSNEFSNRVFLGRPLLACGPIETVAERASRGRVLLRPLRRLLAATEDGDESGVQAAIAERILQSRPGQPSIHGLPVSPREQEHLMGRLRRSMRAMHRDAKRAGVPLVFMIAPSNPAGIWPFAVVSGEEGAASDRLVAAYRGGAREGLLERVEHLLAKAPDRADLHFLHGLLLEEQGHLALAAGAFQKAQDRDQAPMHLTSGLTRTIHEEAARLGRPCLDLALGLLEPGGLGLPDPALFFDHGHLTEEGQLMLALHLAGKLAELGQVPALSDEGQRLFLEAARAHLRARVLPPSRRLAGPNMDWAVGNYHLLFGNFRDALPRLTRAFEGGHTGDPVGDAPFVHHLMFCAFSLAGRTELATDGQDTEAYFLHVHARLVAAVAAGGLHTLVERVVTGGEP